MQYSVLISALVLMSISCQNVAAAPVTTTLKAHEESPKVAAPGTFIQNTSLIARDNDGTDSIQDKKFKLGKLWKSIKSGVDFLSTAAGGANQAQMFANNYKQNHH